MDFEIAEELKMVQTTVREFVKKELLPLEREILGREPSEGRVVLSEETMERLSQTAKEMGFWGLSVPEELGGVGLPTLGLCLVAEELAKTIIPFDFGDVTPILFECNEAQKEQYLVPVIEGQKRGSLALLEPGAAHPTTMETTAVKGNGYYTIDGHKAATSVAGIGDFAMVFAITSKEQGLRGGTTCFLVDRDTPGLTTIGSERAGWQAQVVQPVVLTFNHCQVPAENVLGEEGKAFYLGAEWLPSRRIVRGARCLGAAERLLEVSTERAKTWESFGKLIMETQQVQQALADIATSIHATRLMVYHAAWKADEGEDIRREAAMVKVFATEMVQRVADQAVQLHGGPAYAKELPLERLCRNAIVASATEQALELQRTIIAKEILRG